MHIPLIGELYKHLARLEITGRFGHNYFSERVIIVTDAVGRETVVASLTPPEFVL